MTELVLLASTDRACSSTFRPHKKITAGVIVRVLQRILALTAATWHNDKTNADQAITDPLRATDPVGSTI